jgi:hypothetical protein
MMEWEVERLPERAPDRPAITRIKRKCHPLMKNITPAACLLQDVIARQKRHERAAKIDRIIMPDYRPHTAHSLQRC